MGAWPHGRKPLEAGCHRDEPGAGAAGSLRRGAPPALAAPSSPSAPSSRCPTAHRLVGELVDWGALSRDADRASTSSAGGCGTSGCSPRCRRGCGSWPRRTCTTSTARRSPPCTSRCATAPRCSTSTGSPATRRCPVVSSDRLAAADARDRGRQGAARPRAARGAGRGAREPDPDHAVHDHPAGHACAASSRRVLRDGYATTVEEMSLGACSVAVPIRAGAGGRRRRWGSWCRACARTGPGWSPRCRSPPRASAAPCVDPSTVRGPTSTERKSRMVAARADRERHLRP